MSKILVCIKRVVDSNARVRVKPDGSGIATEGVKMSINPFDEVALEEALRIKERGTGAPRVTENTEIIVASIGPTDAQQQLRTALAMGADRAVLVQPPAGTELSTEPLTVARTILALTQREQPQIVILGRQAIDDDNSQTGQMLAALWGRPQATFASKIEVRDGKATVTREVDAGLETIEVELPAVFTTDLRLNEPRYVQLPDIMKAKRKPLDTLSFADLGITPTPQVKIVRCDPPQVRQKGTKVKDARELVDALKKKGLL